MRHLLAPALLLMAVSCTRSNPDEITADESCGVRTSCPSGGSFRSCISRDGAACRLATSDGQSFACASCADCAGAEASVDAWCNGAPGGGTTNGSASGTSGSTSSGSTTGGSTSSGSTTGGSTSSGSTTGGSTSGGSTTGAGAAVACPSVLLVLDHSASMTDLADDDKPKLDIAKASIRTLVAQHPNLAFGLETFSNSSVEQCSDGIDVPVSPAFGTAQAIGNALQPLGTRSLTNTDAAIARATTALDDPARPSRSIVLLTDGIPNCSGDGSDLARAVTQIQSASQKGLPTFVVALGDTTDTESSADEQLALASPSSKCSGASCSGNHFYPATDGATLDSLLAGIAAHLEMGSCNQ